MAPATPAPAAIPATVTVTVNKLAASAAGYCSDATTTTSTTSTVVNGTDPVVAAGFVAANQAASQSSLVEDVDTRSIFVHDLKTVSGDASGASDEYYFDLTLTLQMNPVAGANGVMFGVDVFEEKTVTDSDTGATSTSLLPTRDTGSYSFFNTDVESKSAL